MLVGIILACAVLVIKTASVIAAVPIGKRWVSAVSVLMGAVLYGMMLVANRHIEGMAAVIDAYTFESAIGMALLFILLGLQPKPKGCKAGSYALHLVPCPFCMLALAVTTAWALRSGHVGSAELLASAAFSTALILTVGGFRLMAMKLKIDPSSFLNPLLLFSGTLTLVFALFIPNYISAAKMGFEPVVLETLLLGPCLGVCVVVLASGYELEKRKQRKGEYSK